MFATKALEDVNGIAANGIVLLDTVELSTKFWTLPADKLFANCSVSLGLLLRKSPYNRHPQSCNLISNESTK